MLKGQSFPAGLYLIATPIGNLGDISLRALWVLQLCDMLLCEDTRVTRKLLQAYGIEKRLVSYHEHNARDMEDMVLSELRAGKRIGLVSDAGTPLISDPGFLLVERCVAEDIYVTALPGAASPVMALSLAGLAPEPFYFAGFLPPKSNARKDALKELAALNATLIFLEAPHRIAESLADMGAVLGQERKAVVARELTKRHETLHRGSITELAAHFTHTPPKGEMVVVVEGKPAESTSFSDEDIDRLIREALQEESLKTLSERIATLTGKPRKTIYQRALALKDEA